MPYPQNSYPQSINPTQNALNWLASLPEYGSADRGFALDQWKDQRTEGMAAGWWFCALLTSCDEIYAVVAVPDSLASAFLLLMQTLASETIVFADTGCPVP